MAAQKIVIDTDIGTDADDSIALALALASPELDLQAITVAGRQSFYRARIARRYLELAGRTDIKVFAGRDAPTPVPLTVACVFDRSFCTFEQLNLEIVVDPGGNIRPVRHPSPDPNLSTMVSLNCATAVNAILFREFLVDRLVSFPWPQEGNTARA